MSNERPVCWACNAPAPKQNHLAALGWRTRRVRIEGQPMRETYCRDCFSVWGWPKPMRERMEGASA